MMNPEIKQKWIDALASATYKQGRERLRHKDEFCCLGVLCDIYSKETGVEWEFLCDVSEIMKIEGCGSFIPIEVEKWAGLESNDPVVNVESLEFTLTRVNDSLNYTFPQIAELIREQL